MSWSRIIYSLGLRIIQKWFSATAGVNSTWDFYMWNKKNAKIVRCLSPDSCCKFVLEFSVWQGCLPGTREECWNHDLDIYMKHFLHIYFLIRIKSFFNFLTLFLYFVLSCDYIFAVGMSLLIAWCLRGAVQSQQSLQPSKTHTLVPWVQGCRHRRQRSLWGPN